MPKFVISRLPTPTIQALNPFHRAICFDGSAKAHYNRRVASSLSDAVMKRTLTRRLNVRRPGRRLLSEPLEARDLVAEHRFKTLGWLLREGRLQIRVGVPLDHLNRPLRRDLQDRYFHSKYGILGDAEGNRVVFLGSDNESAAGWRDNHETFTVAKSWLPEV